MLRNYGYVITTLDTLTNWRRRDRVIFKTKKEAKEYLKSGRNNSNYLNKKYPKIEKATEREYRSAVYKLGDDLGWTNYFYFERKY